MFCDVGPIPHFTRQAEDDDQPGEEVSQNQGVACASNDIKPLLQLNIIHGYHYVYCMFDVAFVRVGSGFGTRTA